MPSPPSVVPYRCRYLVRYTHRVAISNHRLLAFDQERVTFLWKDYAHGGKQGKMTLGCHRVLTPFLSARAAQGLRPDPSLRIPCQSLARFSLGTIAATASPQLPNSCRTGDARSFLRDFVPLALPTLRRRHDREIYGCRISHILLLRFFVACPPKVAFSQDPDVSSDIIRNARRSAEIERVILIAFSHGTFPPVNGPRARG